MNKTRFNPRCYSGTKWSGGDDGVGGGDDDDDPNEVQLDDGDNGNDFPSSGRISPADLCLPESFSLWRVSALWRWRNFLCMVLPVLGFLGGEGQVR